MASSPEARGRALPAYAELHCLSNFSFQRGASHAEELFERARQLGYAALAITDECSVAGIVRAHVASKAYGVPLIVGAEFRLEDGTRLVLLAPGREAYAALSTLIDTGRRRAKKGAYRLFRADVEAHAGKGLLALLLGTEGAQWLAQHFPGDAWIAVELFREPQDAQKLASLHALSLASGLPLVAAGDVHMHSRSRRRLQDTLTAIRLSRPVAECGHALHPNGERHLKSRLRLAQLHAPALLEATVEIADRCKPFLHELQYEYPEEIVPQGHTPTSWLRELVEQSERFRQQPHRLRPLVEKELALIAYKRYEAFFLTVHDVVRFARSQDILCQGRGSAANSAVCFCLGITSVDPATSHGLFERFVSKERDEPPDIDVDFEHERREEVIQYIYEKYGRERTAIAATVISYRSRSALRDVGTALGFDLETVTRLSSSLAWWDGGDVLPERLREGGFEPSAPLIRLWVELARQLWGFPRHLSQHVGGFVISGRRLSELVPTENAAMDKRTVIQWDKDDLEALGLLKVDVLALGMLTALRRALKFIGKKDLTEIPDGDAATYDMICEADTVGVFQIESRAQMSMLPRLRPRVFYDLVIEVAIVRPGPIQGDMVHPYLRRRQKLEAVAYPSEEVKAVLERTLGVPIFQEQVMQVAIVAAGFTPGEADQLRRAMAAWKRKGGLEPFEAKLKAGMRERHYPEAFIERIFQQIRGFGEYGFPESHSTSFAQLAYKSAWVKKHHPAAFLAALLNSQPMGFYQPSQLVRDARRHGVEVRPADACASDWDCTLEDGAVRLGLRMIGGLSQAAGRRIASLRPFDSVAGLAHRAALDRKDLGSLARSGALATLAGHRHLAHWEAAGVETGQGMLARAPVREESPGLAAPAEGKDIVDDYASLGLTLRRHPLALLRARLERMRLVPAAKLNALPNGTPARAAGIVTGRQRPGTATGVVFVTLEDETGYVNVVVWNHIVERDRRALLGASLMTVDGVVQSEGGVVHLVARRITDQSALLGRLATQSRDFH
jgi:error-prone DNA polymerase